MPKFKAKPVIIDARRVLDTAEQLKLGKVFHWAQPGDWVIYEKKETMTTPKIVEIVSDGEFRRRYGPADKASAEMLASQPDSVVA